MNIAIGRAHRVLAAAAALTALVLLGCPPPGEKQPTAEDAATFLKDTGDQLLETWTAAEKADWELSTNITDENEKLSAEADARRIELTTKKAIEATRFDGLDLPYDVKRQLGLLKLSINLPAPSNPQETEELAKLAAEMKSEYGSGEYCGADGECRDLEALSEVIEDPVHQSPEALLEAWQGWRTVSKPMRPQFERYVELANKGARELGFADFGAMWRSKYDMDPDAFAAELDRLFEQVRPLYEAIHCYVRARLAERFGDAVDPEGPIPAHLLGNMWAQTWSNVYDLVAPEGGGDPGYNLTELLSAKGVDPIGMVKYGEGFFTSLGFDPLPETFWERSLFVQPEGRKVVCHASAWDLDWANDLRLKMCIRINAEDFNTIHHELGHNFYQRAYNQLPLLYRESANDGFHEAVGDTIALSITPKYLVDLGFLDHEPDASADIGLLLRKALDKVAFLPFGLLIDQWRWKVFSGEVTPADYNRTWWELRLKYQGIKPPVDRTEEDFDPGAKYHVAANVSYMRYFLADILQFQFHRGLCAAAGYEGPLHRCSIYANKAAGEKLEAMLSMGASRPWPEALEVITGQREMDATAILDYFAPLKEWLDKQNEGRTCGW